MKNAFAFPRKLLRLNFIRLPCPQNFTSIFLHHSYLCLNQMISTSPKTPLPFSTYFLSVSIVKPKLYFVNTIFLFYASFCTNNTVKNISKSKKVLSTFSLHQSNYSYIAQKTLVAEHSIYIFTALCTWKMKESNHRNDSIKAAKRAGYVRLSNDTASKKTQQRLIYNSGGFHVSRTLSSGRTGLYQLL